jgi:hypothetical protein
LIIESYTCIIQIFKNILVHAHSVASSDNVAEPARNGWAGRVLIHNHIFAKANFLNGGVLSKWSKWTLDKNLEQHSKYKVEERRLLEPLGFTMFLIGRVFLNLQGQKDKNVQHTR